MKAILIPTAGHEHEAVTVSTKTVDRARGLQALAILLVQPVRNEEDRKAFEIINACLAWKSPEKD